MTFPSNNETPDIPDDAGGLDPTMHDPGLGDNQNTLQSDDGETCFIPKKQRRQRSAGIAPSISDRYEIRGTVGQGGIGRVLLGYDRQIEREVAIKELLPKKYGSKSDKVLFRFMREAKITGQLEHPGVVPVYEAGTREDGSRYYVMKYVRGRTLEQAIDDCRTDDPGESFRNRMGLLGSLVTVCDCMAYAHSRGVIHRDLKPGNIIIGEFGETVILDWGLAKFENRPEEVDSSEMNAKDLDLDLHLTGAGEILGTPAYMAPEQANPAGGVINRTTDVYALGTILYHTLTGNLPYQATTVKEQFNKLLSEHESPSPRDEEERIPPELAAICLKAMAKRQTARFKDAAGLAEQLRAYRDGRIVSIYAYSRMELVQRFVQRNKGIVAGIAAAILAIIAGAVASIHYGLQADVERDHAIRSHQLAVAAHEEALFAREKAENALTEVADLAQFTLRYSQRTSDGIVAYFTELQQSMAAATEKLSTVDLTSAPAVDPILKNLHRKHPDLESFMIILPPGTIGAVYPDTYASISGLDISDQNHILWIFRHRKPIFSRVFKAVEGFQAITVQMPILNEQGDMLGALACVAKTGEIIPATFEAKLPKGGIWCMQDDGYILYDADPNQVGRYLFRDSMYDEFPELRKLARRMLVEPYGIGIYKFKAYDHNKLTYKVAAWQTFAPSETIQWKIIVVQPYTVE